MESYINESRWFLLKSNLRKQEGNSQVKQQEKSFAAYKTYVRFLKRIVVDYNPENDFLVLGNLHPEKYALPHTYSMRGEFYRLVTDKEKRDWDLV